MYWWEILLICYASFIGVVNFIEYVYLMNEDTWPLLYTPKDFYEDWEMNWFGSTVCWLGEFLLNPIAWLVLLSSKLIGWLFYVGRKN